MGYIISKSNYWWQLLDIHKKYNWHIIDAGLIDPIGKINDVALPTKSIWLVIFLLMYSLYINHKIYRFNYYCDCNIIVLWEINFSFIVLILKYLRLSIWNAHLKSVSIEQKRRNGYRKHQKPIKKKITFNSLYFNLNGNTVCKNQLKAWLKETN